MASPLIGSEFLPHILEEKEEEEEEEKDGENGVFGKCMNRLCLSNC